MFVPTQVFVMFEQIGAFCRLLIKHTLVKHQPQNMSQLKVKY